MKILQLSTKLPYPARDGGALATLNIAKGLSELGHEVHLLCMNTSKHFYPPERIPSSLKKKIHFVAVPVNTSIKPFGLLKNLFLSNNPYHLERFYNKKFRLKLIEKLKKESFDIIQLEGPYLFYYLPLIREYTNARLVLRAHNVEHEIWRKLANESGNNLIKWYLDKTAGRIETLEKTSIKHYDMLVPITSVDEKFFQDQDGCPPTLVVPFGIELDHYKEKEKGKIIKNSLCFIGALDWRPNQTALLWFLDKVWSSLKKEDPSLEFHVAGRNAPANLVENIKKNPVTFHGEVENAVDYMNQHEILIVPLFSGSGIRVKIIEAMALGKVVITTPAGYKGIDCVPGRHLLESRSATDFISRVKSLTRNREKIAEISKNARNLVEEKFDNLAICNKLVEFYEKPA